MGQYMVRLRIQQVHRRSAGKSGRRQKIFPLLRSIPFLPVFLQNEMEVIIMKTKFKRIGRQSVSVILAVMMMLSTMLVGMVTSNADNTVTV